MDKRDITNKPSIATISETSMVELSQKPREEDVRKMMKKKWSGSEEESLFLSLAVKFSNIREIVGDDILNDIISTIRHEAFPIEKLCTEIKTVKDCCIIKNQVIRTSKTSV